MAAGQAAMARLLLCLVAALGHRIVVDRVGEPRSSTDARRSGRLGENVEPEARAAPHMTQGLAPGPGRVRISSLADVGETTTTAGEAAEAGLDRAREVPASFDEESLAVEVEQSSSMGRATPSLPVAPTASDMATMPDKQAGARRVSPLAQLPESAANGTLEEAVGKGPRRASLAEASVLGQYSANATRAGVAVEADVSQPVDDTGFALQNLKTKLDGERKQLTNFYCLLLLFVVAMGLIVYGCMCCGCCERKVQRAKAGKSILKKDRRELQTRQQQLDSLLKEIAGEAEQARLSPIPDEDEKTWSWSLSSASRATAATAPVSSLRRGTASPGAGTRRGTATAKLTFADAHLPRPDPRGCSSSPVGSPGSSPRPPIRIGAGSDAAGPRRTDHAALVQDVSRVAKRLQGFVEKYPKTGGSLLNGRSARKRYVVVLPKPAPHAGEAPDASRDVDLWRAGCLGYWETEAGFTKRERPKGSIALRDIYTVRMSRDPDSKRSVIIEHRQEGQTYEMELLLSSEKAAQMWVANFCEVLRRLHDER